jgi:hypothetical protein
MKRLGLDMRKRPAFSNYIGLQGSSYVRACTLRLNYTVNAHIFISVAWFISNLVWFGHGGLTHLNLRHKCTLLLL